MSQKRSSHPPCVKKFVVRLYEVQQLGQRHHRSLASLERYLIHAKNGRAAIQAAIEQFWRRIMGNPMLQKSIATWLRCSIQMLRELASKKELPSNLVPVAVVFHRRPTVWQKVVAPILEPFSLFKKTQRTLQDIYSYSYP